MTDELHIITEQMLDEVTGGKNPTPSPSTFLPGTSGLGTSGANGSLIAALQSIQSSLKDLGNNNNGLFGGNNGMMFMTMALLMSRHSQVVVRGGRGGFNYSWRSTW